MNLRPLHALLVAALGLSSVAAQEPYTLQTLDNGARIVTVAESRSPLVTIAVTLARDPDPARLRSAADEVFAHSILASGDRDSGGRLARLAAVWSVSVETDRIRFLLSAPGESAVEAVQILLDQLANGGIDAGTFARIREEVADLAYRKRSHPFWAVEDAITEQLLEGGGVARFLQPDPERVRALDLDELLAARGQWTRGPETTVCILGSPPAGLQETLRDRVGSWSDDGVSRAASIDVRPRSRATDGPQTLAVPIEGYEVVHLRIGRIREPGEPSAELSRRVADRVADRAIAGGFTSLLVETLRGRHGLIYGAEVLQPETSGLSAAAITTSCAPQALPEVLRLTRQTLDQAIASGLSRERFLAARNVLWVRTAEACETPEGLTRAIDQGLIEHGDPMHWRRRLEVIRGLSPEAVDAALRRFDPSQLTVVAAGPGVSEVDLAGCWDDS